MPFVTVSAPLLLFVRPEFSLPRDSALIKPTAAQAPRMHCERPCPVVSPRGAERNYKDTTNGARTLTAKTLDGWPEKSLRTRSWDVLRAGGAFRLVQICFTACEGKCPQLLSEFHPKSFARGLETAGPCEGRQF